MRGICVSPGTDWQKYICVMFQASYGWSFLPGLLALADNADNGTQTETGWQASVDREKLVLPSWL